MMQNWDTNKVGNMLAGMHLGGTRVWLVKSDPACACNCGYVDGKMCKGLAVRLHD
jgi:hypothetical protein